MMMLDDREELFLKEIQKLEKRSWKPITFPISLMDGLNRLTRDELVEIRVNLNMDKASGLKKQAIVDDLHLQISDKYENWFNKFDKNRYDILQKAIQHNGCFVLEGKKEFAQLSDALPYMKERGFLFTGVMDSKKCVVMPEEIKQYFQNVNLLSYRTIVNRNTEWCKLAQGIIHHYGMISADEMIKKIESLVSYAVSHEQCLEVLIDATAIYDLEFDGVHFYHFAVLDYQELMNEHARRADLDYNPLTKEQLLQAGELDFVERHPTYKALVSYLTNHYSMESDEADDIVAECEFLIRAGQPLSEIIGVLGDVLELDHSTMEELVKNVVPVMNSTRQWFLKGYSSYELASQTAKRESGSKTSNQVTTGSNIIQFPSGEKVGRNDLCPCGSGKKYKKCCLNKG